MVTSFYRGDLDRKITNSYSELSVRYPNPLFISELGTKSLLSDLCTVQSYRCQNGDLCSIKIDNFIDRADRLIKLMLLRKTSKEDNQVKS